MARQETEKAFIHRLPPEIVDMVYQELRQRERLSLSRTSRQLRNAVIPNLFQTVFLNTRRPSNVSFFLRAAPQYGHVIKEVQVALPPATCDKPDCPKCTYAATRVWSAEDDTVALLRGDHDMLLPSLREISVVLPTNFGGHAPYTQDDIDELTDAEDFDEDDRKAREAQLVQWDQIQQRVLDRANAAFTALSHRRAASIVKHLSIVNLSPICDLRQISACATPDWKSFLSSLEEFYLSLWAGDEDFHGPDYSAWWRHASAAGRFTDFVNCLAGYTFDHLASVKNVTFQCSPGAFVGQNDPAMLVRPLPLVNESSPPDTMPLLTTLELGQIMVDRPLLDFLKTRAGRAPLSLVLRDTMAYWYCNRKAGDFGEWTTILDGITDLISSEEGPRLRQFQLRHWGEVNESSDYGVLPFHYAFLSEEDGDFPDGYWPAIYHTPVQRDYRYGPSRTRATDEDAYDDLKAAIALFNEEQKNGI